MLLLTFLFIVALVVVIFNGWHLNLTKVILNEECFYMLNIPVTYIRFTLCLSISVSLMWRWCLNWANLFFSFLQKRCNFSVVTMAHCYELCFWESICLLPSSVLNKAIPLPLTLPLQDTVQLFSEPLLGKAAARISWAIGLSLMRKSPLYKPAEIMWALISCSHAV